MSLELYSTTEALELSFLFSEPKEPVETVIISKEERSDVLLPQWHFAGRNATGISSKLNACPLFSLGRTDRFGLFEFRKHFSPLFCISEIPAEGAESASRGEISKTQICGAKLK